MGVGVYSSVTEHFACHVWGPRFNYQHISCPPPAPKINSMTVKSFIQIKVKAKLLAVLVEIILTQKETLLHQSLINKESKTS